jgi:tetratricopeptide (TPR) repeat protein
VAAGLVAAGAVVLGVYWRELWAGHHFEKALAALDQGRPDAVQRELADLEGVPAYEPHRHFLRGAVLLHARRFYPALDEFGHSVDYPELRVRTLTLSGAALYGLKKYQDAARLLAAAVEADPDAVDAHRWLASAYYDLGLTQPTLAELSRVAELAPADPHPHRLMGLMYKDFERYDAAVEQYRESLRRDANQTEREPILLEMAECQIKLQRLDDALATLAQCQPSPQRWTKEADCHYQAGRTDEARPLLDRTLQQSPADLSALLLTGTIALQDGKAPVAVDAFVRATTAYPKDHVAHYKLSQAYHRVGNHALADQHARIADELRKSRLEFSKLHQTAAAEPGNADVRCRLGVLAGEVGRPDLAQVWFQAALAIDPRHQETLRRLGGSASPSQQRGPDAVRLQGGAPSVVAKASEPAAGTASPAPAAVPIRLHEVTEETGISFQHTDGSSGKRYIPETVSAGVALFDYDGDGRSDIYFPNGAPLPGAKVDKPPRHALYRNLGGWRFRDVTEEAGVACTGYGMGAAAADYDNDGHADLYVSNFGPKVLYRNNGNGTFTDVTAKAGVADGNKVGAGACFLDIDGDGHLDLFAANYVKFTYDKHVVLDHAGFPEYAGPKEYPPDRQTLFRNRGDGTFSDVSVEAGIARHLGKGMGAVCADYNDDGRADILLLNDVFENFCFRNDGTGKFEEVALAAGFKYNGEGMPLGSMGVDCADYDNDGRLDFFQTSYQRELPVLYRNLGNGAFEDATVRAGAAAGLNNVKWGCGFVDFDNDGHRDLFIGLGHLQDLIDQYDPTTSYRTRNIVLRNLGNGKFVDVSDQCGDGLLPKHSARGVAFEDLDNDGDIDVVVLNSRERPTILRNMLYESGGKNHRLEIRLQGVKTNRDGVGARVRVVAGNLTQIDEVHSGRGYQSHWGLRLHFGLGPRDRVDRIEVRWIGGGVDVLENVPADQLLVITEGS